MSDRSSSRSGSSSSTTLKESYMRGAALARQEKEALESAHERERIKQEEAQSALERRKSYGRVQRRVASPAKGKRPAPPRPPLAPVGTTHQKPESVPSLRRAISAAESGKNKRGPDPKGTPHRSGPKKRHGTPQRQSIESPAAYGPAGPPLPASPKPPERMPSTEDLIAEGGEDDFEHIEAMCLGNAEGEASTVVGTPAMPRHAVAPDTSMADGPVEMASLFERRPFKENDAAERLHTPRGGVIGKSIAIAPVQALEVPDEVPSEVAVDAPADEEPAPVPRPSTPRDAEVAEVLRMWAAPDGRDTEMAAGVKAAAQPAEEASSPRLSPEALPGAVEIVRGAEDAEAPAEMAEAAEAAQATEEPEAHSAEEPTPSGPSGEAAELPQLSTAADIATATRPSTAVEDALADVVATSSRKPAARRQERGSLFARLRLGGGEEAAPQDRTAREVPQQLQAMTEQLEAVTACMKVEQQARVAAEAQLEEARDQVNGLLRHLSEMEKVRQEEASTLAALRGLLGQVQGENAGLKEQNASLLGQCRSLMGSIKR